MTGIPWRVVPLRSVATMMTNGFVGTATPHYRASGIPYLMANNVGRNQINLDRLVFVSEEFHRRQKRSEIRTDDLLTVQTGFIGVSCLAPPEVDGANAHALIITRVDHDTVDPRYLCELLNSDYGRRQIARIQTGGGRPHLNTGDLESFPLPLPDLNIQRAGATVFRQIQNTQQTLDRLIEMKRQWKRGLAQVLLAGEAPVSTSNNSWRRRPLSDFFEHFVEPCRDVARTPLTCSKIHGVILQSEKFGKRLASDNLQRYKVVRRGDLVFDPMLLWDASISFVEQVDEGVVSPAYSTFHFKGEEGHRDFFRALIKSQIMRHEYRRLSRGTNARRKKVLTKDFLRISLLVPNRDEQAKIGAALSLIEREIVLLERQRMLLEQQKRGVMHRLLTGTILPSPIA